MTEPSTPGERVVVAMSGGVDSSVAAARLVASGFAVIGVTLHLWDYPEGEEPGRCCAPEDQHDARNVADQLGVPHYTFDRRELFRDTVVAPFVDAYVAGETPSPCVQCNRTVKLRELFAIADRLGATRVATGHYARMEERSGHAALLRGVDRRKDQSYFLHTLVGHPDAQRLLRRLVFPLGNAMKEDVRKEAIALALPGATKGESQELCFVSSGRYDRFVAERAGARVRPGPIVDETGRTIGQHDGLHAFTIGQRKGLGAASSQRPRGSATDGKPLFVVGLDAATNTVRAGGDDALLASTAWLGADESFADDVSFPRPASVQVRARHPGAPATVHRAGDGRLVVRFDEPVRAVSPGQIAVLYDGERVLGGAPIRGAQPSLEPPALDPASADVAP